MHSAVPSKLAEALRLQTRSLHVQVERSSFMQSLLRGRIDRPRYCVLLRNLHAIYAALEAGLERHAAHPQLAPARIAGLPRQAALAADLAALQGPDWESAIALLPAAASYVRRLQHLDTNAPGLLLAHAYVRYLGDLSGGQLLRRIVSEGLALRDGDGTQFYAFDEPDRAPELAQRFRAALDGVAIGPDGIAALVAEAQWGFTCHGCLFEQIQPGAQEMPAGLPCPSTT